jgi:excisionase family DNA binding protein
MRYLSKKEFASRVGLSVRSIDRWIAQRRIRTRILVTGGVRIPETELDKCFKPDLEQFLKDKKYKRESKSFK